jgi:predicted CXXCH cytochrome family protein
MAANIGNAAGYGAGGLQCKDCHRPTEDGIRFQKIDMERDCEACHSLTYDQVGGIFRKLRHGDVDQVIADLSASDFRREAISVRRRPGDYAQGRPYHFNFSGSAWKGLQVGIALSKDGICGECHRPASRADGKVGVQPVTLVSRYMDHGWFDHAAHKQEECTSCHAAQTSTSATDLLLPGIKDCRQCHLGEETKKAKVPSSCVMCHGFHMSGQGTAAASDKKQAGRSKEHG